MKKMQKLGALLLVLVMVLAMSTTALAADSGTLTINDSKSDVTYTLYKILNFSSSDYFSLYPSNADIDAALRGAGASVLSGTVNIDGYSAQGVMDALPAQLAAVTAPFANFNAVETKTGNGSTITFALADSGVYVVAGSNGFFAAVDVYHDTTSTFTDNTGETATTGSITVTSDVKGQTYKIYRVANLESFDGDAYSYTAVSEWLDFLKGADELAVNQVGDKHYVTTKEGQDLGLAEGRQFAKDMLAYAEEEGIDPVATLTADEDENSVTFENLPMGWYLVDSSMGSLCMLYTNDPTVDIEDKNEIPSLTKTIDGNVTTASIGDTLNFTITVTAQPGAENYVIYDLMGAGLTLDPDSIEVEDYAETTDYTVDTTATADYTFKISFKNSALADIISEAKDIEITYSALVNADATGENITNKAWMDWDNIPVPPTPPVDLITRTFELKKVDAEGNLLRGAIFSLYDSEGAEVSLIYDEEKDGYRPILPGEVAGDLVVDDGEVTVFGLASGQYELQEDAAPEGYNLLAGRVEVDLTAGDKTGENAIKVINQSGTKLPETGGMGTTMLYVLGTVLVLGAAVLLVSKKRMQAA